MDGEDGAAVLKKADIDTRPPFRSVKEAVILFGELVLAGEVYSSKLKEREIGEDENGSHGPVRVGTLTAELEETKQSLQKARDESVLMATCLSSLQEELERTKRELRQIKERESSEKRIVESSEIEDLKFAQDHSTDFEIKAAEATINRGSPAEEFQKKRYVTFANPHVTLPNQASFARVIVPHGDAVLERHPSLRKKKKKPLIPLLGGIFSKKKKGGSTLSGPLSLSPSPRS